jgi:hypothetical protein
MKYLLLTLALAFGLGSLPAAGQGAISPTIGVTPAKFFETVTPGQSREYKVKLRNLGTDAIPLSATVTDIDDISDEGVPIFSAAVAKRSASSWLELGSTDVIVNPGETKEVAFSVTAPSDAAPGGYTAAIIFQAHLPSYYFDIDASARILPAISVLAFFTVPGEGEITVDQVTLESFRVPPIVVSSPMSVVAEVKNGSNFFVQTDAAVSVKSAFSDKTTEQTLGSVILLPEKSRKFITAIEDSLFPGVYTATVNFKQGDRVLVGNVRFVALPWSFIILLTLLGAAALGFAGRKRLRRAWAVLRGRETRSPRRPTLR